MAGYPRGIDVSMHQGWINWDQVAASGVQFAICKATEGIDWVDTWFAHNWSECGRVNIARGSYHYALPSRYAPADEARWFVQTVGPKLETGDLVCLDLEDPAFYGDASGWTLAWLETVAGLVHFRPLVYTSPSYANAHGLGNQPAIGDYGCWLASWGVPTPPPAPAPWSLIAIHQIGVGPAGAVPGVLGQIDLDRFNGASLEQFKLYGKPAGSAPIEPEPAPEPPSELPVYDWQEPSRLQETDADCACESIEWCLYAWGRTPDDDWIEQSMQAAGVWNPQVGCTDATGAGLATWVNEQYGSPADGGYLASNEAEATWEMVTAEAAALKHPIALGGRAFYHWVGVRNFDTSSNTLLLANPAPGYQGVYDTLTRSHWDALGPWSYVRVTNPAAEADPPQPEPAPEPDPPPVTVGQIGSGLLELMAQDGVAPAQTNSMWIGGPPAEIEQCYADSGTLYVWVMSENRGYRIKFAHWVSVPRRNRPT